VFRYANFPSSLSFSRGPVPSRFGSPLSDLVATVSKRDRCQAPIKRKWDKGKKKERERKEGKRETPDPAIPRFYHTAQEYGDFRVASREDPPFSLSLSLSLSARSRLWILGAGSKVRDNETPRRREGAPSVPRVFSCRARVLSHGATVERCSTIVRVHFGTRELAGMQAESERAYARGEALRGRADFYSPRARSQDARDEGGGGEEGGKGLLRYITRYTRRGSARSSSRTRKLTPKGNKAGAVGRGACLVADYNIGLSYDNKKIIQRKYEIAKGKKEGIKKTISSLILE